MSNRKTISVYTCCNDAITGEFTLFEGIESALSFADEVIYVDGGSKDGTTEYIYNYFRKAIIDEKLKLYSNKWENRMYKNMFALQKNVALSHCTKDICCLMDSDEVFHEKDIDKITDLLNNNLYDMDSCCFNTLHFYKDYNLINDNPDWYKSKVYMFRNKKGFHHGSSNPFNDDDIITFDRKDAKENSIKVNVEMFHYSKVRSEKCLNEKHLWIESMFHPNEKFNDWKWDMTYTKEFKGTHPKYMKERIKCNKDINKIKELYK